MPTFVGSSDVVPPHVVQEYDVHSAIHLYTVPLASENRQTQSDSEITETCCPDGDRDVCRACDEACALEYSTMRKCGPNLVTQSIASD